MRQHHDTLVVTTSGSGFTDITALAQGCVRASGLAAGTCTLLVQHTSASLLIQENADPSVRRDLHRVLERLVPAGADYEHDDEGPDDMAAHARATLTATTLTIPVLDGRLRLGTWQAIYLWEHRDRGRQRHVAIAILGE